MALRGRRVLALAIAASCAGKATRDKAIRTTQRCVTRLWRARIPGIAVGLIAAVGIQARLATRVARVNSVIEVVIAIRGWDCGINRTSRVFGWCKSIADSAGDAKGIVRRNGTSADAHRALIAVRGNIVPSLCTHEIIVCVVTRQSMGPTEIERNALIRFGERPSRHRAPAYRCINGVALCQPQTLAIRRGTRCPDLAHCIEWPRAGQGTCTPGCRRPSSCTG